MKIAITITITILNPFDAQAIERENKTMPRQNRFEILLVFVNYFSSSLSGRTAVTQAKILL